MRYDLLCNENKDRLIHLFMRCKSYYDTQKIDNSYDDFIERSNLLESKYRLAYQLYQLSNGDGWEYSLFKSVVKWPSSENSLFLKFDSLDELELKLSILGF